MYQQFVGKDYYNTFIADLQNPDLPFEGQLTYAPHICFLCTVKTIGCVIVTVICDQILENQHLPGGIKTTVSPNRKELSARKLNSPFIKNVQ